MPRQPEEGEWGRVEATDTSKLLWFMNRSCSGFTLNPLVQAMCPISSVSLGLNFQKGVMEGHGADSTSWKQVGLLPSPLTSTCPQASSVTSWTLSQGCYGKTFFEVQESMDLTCEVKKPSGLVGGKTRDQLVHINLSINCLIYQESMHRHVRT